jgi:hypothetical protein
MVRMGLVAEIVSLIICIIIGLIFAVAMLPFSVSDDWPVQEMLSRGTMTNLWVGFPTAFFSGLLCCCWYIGQSDQFSCWCCYFDFTVTPCSTY